MGGSGNSDIGSVRTTKPVTANDPLSTELEEFFDTFQLQRAPRVSSCERIRRYVEHGNRTKGVTPVRRAEILRELQTKWIGQRISYANRRIGTVLYIVPLTATPIGRQPFFEAMVRWEEPINEHGQRTTMVSIGSFQLMPQ